MLPRLSVTAHLVDVRIGANPATLPEPVTALAVDDVPVVVTVLNEREVDELRPPDHRHRSPSRRLGDPRRLAVRRSGGPRTRRRESAARCLRTRNRRMPSSPVPTGLPESSQATALALSGGPGAAGTRLGISEAAYGELEEIDFDPGNLVTNFPTRTSRSPGRPAAADARDQSDPPRPHAGSAAAGLILDFRRTTYSSRDYTTAEGLTVLDANFGGLPFNPLEPAVDPASGRVNPMGHVHKSADPQARLPPRRSADVSSARSDQGKL